MGLGDVWNRTLVYFGIAEDEDWDDDVTVTDEEVERDYRRRERQNVRKLPRREQEWTEADSMSEADVAAAAPRGSARRSRLRGVERNAGQVRVHLVLPRSFNDAQQIADRFKDSVPVILNPSPRTRSSRSASSTSRAGSRTRSTAACSGSPTRCSS
jgi:cell division inhibitor SepF